MVVFAGKLISGTKFECHFRLLFMPWVKSRSIIIRSCSNSSSSLPVRYIPKKSSKTNELQTSSPPMKGSEDKRINSRASCFDGDERRKCLGQSSRLPPLLRGFEDKDMRMSSDSTAFRDEFSDDGKSLRRGFGLDGRFQNGTRGQEPGNSQIPESEIGEDSDCEEGVEYEFMEQPKVVVEELSIHQTEDAHEQLVYEGGKTRQVVEKMAVELLAARAFTAVQLKKKLLGKKHPLHIVDAVIADFQSRGFINDLMYAETFARSRWSSSSWGPRRIKKALSEKGVSKGDAEKAVDLVFEDEESGDDTVSGLGLSKLSMDHLLSQATKQWLRGKDVPIEKQKSRIIRWLQYRGFNWGVVSFVLNKLQAQNPP